MGWKRYRKYQKKEQYTITIQLQVIQVEYRGRTRKIHMKTTDTVTGLLTSQGNVSFICQNVTQQVFADNLNFCCHVNQPLIAVNLSKPIMPPQYSDMSDNMPIQCHLPT